MGSVFGYEIDSDYPLARLNRAPGTRGGIKVRRPVEPLPEPEGDPQSMLETDDGQLVYASYPVEGGCLLVMPPTAAFLIERERLTVTVEGRDQNAELFEHRLFSSAICTML